MWPLQLVLLACLEAVKHLGQVCVQQSRYELVLQTVFRFKVSGQLFVSSRQVAGIDLGPWSQP